MSQGVRVARLAGASYYDQVISIPRKPWTYAGSTGSDSDSRSRVDEFGKQSWAVNAVPRRCRSESPALIRTQPPLWSILCGESPDRADLTPGSGVGARRRHSHGKRECGASESFYWAHSASLGNHRSLWQSTESIDFKVNSFVPRWQKAK